MIQSGTKMEVADNSGAKIVECVKVLGGSKRMAAYLGDVVVVSVKSCVPNGKVKKGDVCRALIVRVAKGVKRADGSGVKFDKNAVVLVGKLNDPVGTRVFGPVAREIRNKGFMKVVSLAPEVL